jgi:hypothetical protein
MSQLCEPVLDGAIRNTNFFNGRILTAEDLSDQQLAERRHRQHLGQTIGSGVVRGLEITLRGTGALGRTAPAVRVSAGLALTPRGDALEVSTSIDVVLARQEPAASTLGQFELCTTVPPPGSGVGVYVLLLCPARGYLGQAPRAGLDGSGTIEGCGSRYALDGVTFRLVPLVVPGLAGLSAEMADPELSTLFSRTDQRDLAVIRPGDLSRLRSRIAQLCFGTRQVRALTLESVGAREADVSRWGALDELFANGTLTADDVPLAIVYWTSGGIAFVDSWSVRRRPAAPPAGTAMAVLISDRRQREAEAILLQFDEHIRGLLGSGVDAGQVAADEYFTALPPCGTLPIRDTRSLGGFDTARFFGRYASHDVSLIDLRMLRQLLHEAQYHEPIDLASEGRIQLYRIWENVQAVGNGSSTQLTLVFASAALPYSGVARFAHARWDLSRFAPTVI